jgi:hypothetical protein
MYTNKLTLGHGCGFRIESSFTANTPLYSKKGYTTVSGLWYFPNFHGLAEIMSSSCRRSAVYRRAWEPACGLVLLPEEVARTIILEWLCLKPLVSWTSLFATRNCAKNISRWCMVHLQRLQLILAVNIAITKAVLAWIAARSVQLDGICVLKGCKVTEELLETWQ